MGMDSLRRYFGPANVVGLLRQQSEDFEMNIEHKLEPIEHWIVDGKAYRLATEKDVGKFCLRSETCIGEAVKYGHFELTSFEPEEEKPYVFGIEWRFAYVQDDSLLTPQRTPVPALGDGWFLLRDDEVLQVGDKVTAIGLHAAESWVLTASIGRLVKDWRRGVERYLCARYFGSAKEPEPAVEIQPQAAKPIDWTKPVRTKDGRAVRVLCTDAPGEYPVVGIIDGYESPETWMIDGTWLQGEIEDTDLENAPRRIQREFWVNVYADDIGIVCVTKQAADEMRGTRCFACVKITIDCEEGEGL